MFDPLIAKAAPRYLFDLNRVRQLANQLNNPQRSYPSIHVAGTNGKGSVCWKIAAALQLQGYRVGLYTSPHLIDWRERISIWDKQVGLISEEEIVQGWQELLVLDPHDRFSFFERLTLLAFRYFAQRQVDIAIIETGLGGRLDATNILDPILTVITSISQEHTALLGPDLESIAKEKAGILKSGIPGVLGPTVIQAVVKERALEIGAPLWQVLDRGNSFEEQNRLIAQRALEVLSYRIPLRLLPQWDQHIQWGILQKSPCRLEEKGSFIFDVAHNPAAFTELVRVLQQRYPGETYHFLIGLSQDKDHAACFEQIIPVAHHLTLVQTAEGRLTEVHLLGQCLEKKGFRAYSCFTDVGSGLQSACLSGERVIVCGSFYIMKEALAFVKVHLAKT